MKKLFRLFLLLVLVVAGVLGFASWKLGQYLTPGALAAQLEKKINSRVEIESVEVSLFGSPARVVIKGLALGARDKELSKAYEDRTPLKGATVTVEEAVLAVDVPALLKQQLEIKELRLQQPRVTMLLFEEGGNSLDVLFKSPDEDEEEQDEEEDVADSSDDEVDQETFHVSQLDQLNALEGVALKDGTISVVIEKTGLVLAMENLNLVLEDLVLDHKAEIPVPTVELNLSGQLSINSSASQGSRYGLILFDGVALTDLFDPKTGELAIAAETEVVLTEESYLGTNIPVVQKAWDGLKKLDKVGVKIGPLPEKATFGESRAISLYYEEERVTLRKPFALVLDDWHLGLEADSWIQMETEVHEGRATLVAREKFSVKAREQLERGAKNLPKEIRSEMVIAIEEAWFRDGRLYAQLVSDGELSDPSLDVVNKMPDLERVAKDALKDYAKDRLKKLFGD